MTQRFALRAAQSSIPQSFPLRACALATAVLLSACGGGGADAPPAATPPADTTPPALTISDSEAGASANGPVTFTFDFTEDVGSSFTADDITVTGGAAGTLTKVSGTRYTLVVTPAAGVAGTISVGVAALKFTDAALNGNTVAASALQAYSTVVAGPSGKTGTCTTAPCVGFEDAKVGLVAFEGLGSATVVNDPMDATNKVARLVKVASGQPWAGATIHTSDATAQTLDPVGFATSKVITLRVFAPAAGETIRLKVETGPNGGGLEKDAVTTQANTWETLTFDFTSPTAGTYDPAKVYRTVSVFPKFLSAVTQDATYYVDELKYAAAPAAGPACGTTEPSCAPSTVIPAGAITLYSETSVTAGFNAFPNWGQATTYSEVTLAGNKSLKYANLNYQGIEFTAVDVSGKGKLHLDLWSPDITSVKVSLISPGKENAVTKTLTTKGWNSVDIDLAQYTAPDLKGIFQIKLEATGNGTLFVDNIHLWGTPAPAVPGTTPNPTAKPGSAGPVTLPLLTAALFGDFAGPGDGLFAGDYIGPVDANGNHAQWGSATTNGAARNGNIGYFQDSALSTSPQKLEENGWVAGLTDNPLGVPSFFRYVILTAPASGFTNSYMGLYANAPNNGTVDVSSFGAIKFRLWGPAEMYQTAGLNPTLEMKLTGPQVAGCTATGSGATEIRKTFVADQKIGAASTYKLSLAGWSVVGVCGSDTTGTAVASVLARLAQVVVTVPGTSFNFTKQNTGGTQVTFATGVNLGPIAFTPN